MRPLGGLLFLTCFVWVGGAAAQQPANDGQLRLLNEPHSWVDVVDAFDDEDPFDINVSVGFLRTWQAGNVQRENFCDRSTSATCPYSDPNRLSRNWLDVAHSEQSQNILQLGLDVGIFRDLALYGRLPLVLSDDRSLGRINGADPSGILTADANPGTNMYPPLFNVGPDGFHAPTRSGLDYITAGLAWSPFNQHREPGWPTLTLLAEGRINVGDPLRACQQTPTGPQCIQEMRDPITGTYMVDRTAGRNAGMSSGVNALRLEMRASWRTQYVEPYGGLAFQIAWPGTSDRFFLPANNLQGFINDRPPIQGVLTGGMAIIPWEDRGAWRKFTIDVRFMGTYVSEGHTYSPLFDALGTSMNPYLTEPVLEGRPNGMADLRSVQFYGLTDVQSHAEIGTMLGFEMQAARFVRFSAGFALWYIQPYMITFADACNPNVSPTAPMPGPDGMLGTGDDIPDPREGTCRSGIINPHHRSAIDLPGQRFRINEQIRVDLYISATAMF